MFVLHLKVVLNMTNFPDIKVVKRKHQQQCMKQQQKVVSVKIKYLSAPEQGSGSGSAFST